MATVKNISMVINNKNGKMNFNNISVEKAMHIIYAHSSHKDQQLIDWDQFLEQTKILTSMLTIGGTHVFPMNYSNSVVYITRNF